MVFDNTKKLLGAISKKFYRKKIKDVLAENKSTLELIQLGIHLDLCH